MLTSAPSDVTMRVLYTTPILQHPPAGGPQLRVESSIKALSTQCELYIVSRAAQKSVGKMGEVLYRSLARAFYYAPAVAGSRYQRRLRRILRRNTPTDTESSAAFIVELVDRLAINVVWFGHGQVSFPLMSRVKDLRPSIQMVCDTDSVWSRFVLRELPFQSDPLKRAAIEQAGRIKEMEERAWVNLCDATTAVSDVDADYYREIARDPKRVQIFSNAIDLSRYDELPPPPTDLKSPSIYLAGTFGHPDSPMDTAGRWVIDEVLPRVRTVLPDIHFYIVGTGSDLGFGHVDDPAVIVKGRLPSVLPYLCNVDVALVPLKYESGTRFKILEAGACGTPLVSTALGAEGIPVRHGEHILLADDPADFAAAIVKLIVDRPFAQLLARNCRQLVRESYGIDALTKEADNILTFLARESADVRSAQARALS